MSGNETKATRSNPIFPRGAAPLRVLTVTMAVMSYLACLALGALILINRATSDWTQGISREITVQVRQVAGVDSDQEVLNAIAVLAATPGVKDAQAMPPEEAARLLQPWLGAIAPGDLPIPRLIRVLVDDTKPPDIADLTKSLMKDVKGASVDAHKTWQDELTRMARSLNVLGGLVLALILIASVTVVIFAARSVIAANQRIVDVLELIGAEPKFISKQVDQQFLLSGLAAGMIGMLAALLTFGLMGFMGGVAGEGVAEVGKGLAQAPRETLVKLVSVFLVVPIAATLLALWTSRLTLLRLLGRIT